MQQKFAPKIKERQVTYSREEIKERQAKDDSDNSTQQSVRVLHVINFLELIEFHVRVQPIGRKVVVKYLNLSVKYSDLKILLDVFGRVFVFFKLNHPFFLAHRWQCAGERAPFSDR